MAGVDLVAAVDADLEKATATGVPAFTDSTQMLEEVKPDIVDIITPPPTHLNMIKAALAISPKAIICQKPFCLDLDQAKEAAQLSAAWGVPIIVHENFRFQPWYRAIKTALTKGLIGEVQQITFRLRPGDGQGNDAYLDRQPYFQKMERFLVHETAVHWIDTFRYLLGEPKSVFADLRKLNPVIAGEDAGFILFEYDGGMRAVFDGNRHLDHSAENTRCTMGEGLFEGTKGTLELLGDGSVHHRRFGERETSQILPPTTETAFGGGCVEALQSHVVSGITLGSGFENTAKDYLTVIEQEHAIYAAAQSRAWIEI
jgi:predicted dehydrogenase